MNVKKYANLLFLICLFASGCCVAQNIHGNSSLSLSITKNSSGIAIRIENRARHDVAIELPVILTINGAISGIELVIRNISGVRYDFCANTQPLNPPMLLSLGPNGQTYFTMRLKELFLIYCPDPGKYKLTAIYHHVISGEMVSPDIVSDDIFFDVKESDLPIFHEKGTK